VHNGVRSNQRAADRRVVHGRPHDRYLAAGRIDLARSRPQQPDVRIRLEELALARETLGQRQIVRVEAGDERRARQLERAVQRER
jgi:hypothetical protein